MVKVLYIGEDNLIIKNYGITKKDLILIQGTEYDIYENHSKNILDINNYLIFKDDICYGYHYASLFLTVSQQRNLKINNILK